MAEFMTALPQLAGDSNLQHSPGTGGSISPGAHHPAYHAMMDPHGVADPSGVNVPEYPWMKEKKTTRKSNQQGKFVNRGASAFVSDCVIADATVLSGR